MSDYPSQKKLARAVSSAAHGEAITERRFRRWLAVIALIEVLKIANRASTIPAFLVKGGFSLELRFGNRARSSRDLDIVVDIPPDMLVAAFVEALRGEWSGFAFRLKSPPEERPHAVRIEVNSLYLKAPWATFEVDLVTGSADIQERVEAYDLGAFGLASPSAVPCLNVSHQLAQKIYAVTDPDDDRARDLIDIYLLDRAAK